MPSHRRFSPKILFSIFILNLAGVALVFGLSKKSCYQCHYENNKEILLIPLSGITASHDSVLREKATSMCMAYAHDLQNCRVTSCQEVRCEE